MASVSQPRRSGVPRWVAWYRVVTATLGGYLFANAASIAIAKTLPVFRGDAVATAYLLSFILFMLAVMWVYAHRSLWRGCATVWLVTAALGALGFALTVLGGR
ncbi:MAG: hypothetical protein AAF493_26845 [Pseudomonadota bacterium]